MAPKRPMPDPGVTAAVESCQSNPRMKRMVLFGLRALSELCTPPRGRYKENALDAVARHITGTLIEVSNNLSSDEEVMELVLKVCWGIAVALEDYKDAALISQFQSEGGAQLTALAVNAAPSDPSVVMTTFGMLEAFANVGIDVNAADMTPGLLKALKNPQLSSESSVKVAAAISSLAHRGQDAYALAQEGTALLLVNFAASCAAVGDPQSTDAAYHALIAAGCIAKAGGGDTACVTQTKDLVERFKGTKKIVDAGSEALAGMLTLDQLSTALDALNTAAVGSPERTSALEILSAMSYVQAFAEAIVESGCVALLVQAVNSTLDDLAAGSRDETLIKGFVGTVTLLGRISRNAVHAQQVYDAGGLTGIATALGSVTDHGESYGACCTALAALANAYEAYAAELDASYGVSATVLGTLYENASDRHVHEGSLEFLAAMSQYGALQSPLIEASAIEIVGYSLQYDVDSLTAQTFGFTTLLHLVPGVYTTASIYEYGGFQGISQSLSANVMNEPLAARAVQVLGTLATVPDAKNYTTDGAVVDAVLYAMLEHATNGVITGSGREVLENLATTEDADRHVRALDGALSSAAQDNAAAFKALAAARGLSRVQRLSATFEKANAVSKVLKHLKRIVESPGGLASVYTNVARQRVSVYEKLLRAAFATIEAVALSSAGSLDDVIPDAINAAGSDKMKPLLTGGSTTPEVMFTSILKLVEVDRIQSEAALKAAITNAAASLRKFGEYRTLGEIILGILAHLAGAMGGAGAKILVEIGGVKVVIEHMRKLPFSARTQIAGMRIIGAVLHYSPETAADLRKAGTVEIVQAALRTHQNDKELRACVAPILAHLIPISELEELASRNIVIIRGSLDTMDFKKTAASMRMCNDFGVCAEGARALARVGAAKELRRINDIEGLDADRVEIYAQGAQMINLVSGQRVGASALMREGIVETLLKLIPNLTEAGHTEGVAHALAGLGRVLRGDPGSAAVCMRHNIVRMLTTILQDYPNDAMVVPAACAVVGALARTDEQAATLVAQPEIRSMIERFNAQLADPTLKRDQRVVLLKALEELMYLENPTMAGLVAEAGLIPTLVDQLDAHLDDPEIVRTTASVLARTGNVCALRDFWESQRGADVRPVLDRFVGGIKEQMNDSVTAGQLIRALARFSRPGEAALFRETGILDAIRNALVLHPDDDDLQSACSELLEATGASDAIRQHVDQAIAAEAAGDVKAFNDALEYLNVLLLAPVPDLDDYLANEEALWGSLTRQLQTARDAGDLKTMRNIMITAQRLVDQGKVDPNGYHGAWYFSQTMMPVCNDMLTEGGAPFQAKRLVTAMMNALAGAAQNPNTHQIALDTIPVGTVIKMLEVNQNDMDQAAAMTGLLYFMGMDAAGIDTLKGHRRDIMPLLSNIMRVHRGRVKVAVPAMGLTGRYGRPGPEAVSPAFTNAEAIKAAVRGTGTAAEAQGYLDANMMEMMAECIANPEIRSVMKSEGVVQTCVRRLDVPEEGPPVPTRRLGGAEIPEPVTIRNHYAFARMLEAYGLSGEALHVYQYGGVKKLEVMLDEFADNPKVYYATMDALAALAIADPPHCGQEMMGILPQRLFGGGIEPSDSALDVPIDPGDEVGKLLFLDGDPGDPVRLRRAYVAVRMLEAMREQPGWEEIRKRKKIQQILTYTEEVAEAHGDEELLARIAALKEGGVVAEAVQPEVEAPEMEITAAGMAFEVDPEDPNALTLKEVHDWLLERIETNQVIDINDTSEPILYERFQFVFTKMTDYADLMLGMQDFAGYQSQWGCKAWVLWVTYTPDVISTLLQWEVHNLMFDYLNHQAIPPSGPRQKEVVVGTPPSAALAAFAGVREPGATTLATYPQVAACCTQNINVCLDDPRAAKNEENAIPRVEMVEKVAINRAIFADPAIVYVLLRCWDQYDAGIYSTLALRHVFRAMRRVVCDNHTDAVIEQNVTQRLIDELKKDFDNPLLIDGFFLLGVLAIDTRLKTLIGQQNGIEESLTILRNHMEDPPGEGVITNSQLALANLVVGHRNNCNQFYKHGGLQLNVRVLNERGEHFDETNAAAALLTNACFRREDIKAAYGQPEIGAPSALSYAISCYDGGTDQAALRCLSNMFKAISNMSLYTPNIDLFLESGLENAYYNLLVQSAGLPDDVVKTGLFTLSNLTWENKEENMARFGIIVPPLIDMASQGTREDPGLLANTFETLAFLLRLPSNVQQFCEYGGVRLGVHLIRAHAASSGQLLQQGLVCLGTAARTAETVQYLLSEDVLGLVKDVLEGKYFLEEESATQFESSLTALRIVRRMMLTGGAEAVGTFGQQGGDATVVWYLESLAANEDPLPQLALESVRGVVGILSMGQGDDPAGYISIDEMIDTMDVVEKKKGGWFGRKEKEEREVLPPLERPTTPRGHEVIGLDAAAMQSLATSILRLCQSESLHRSVRFTRCAMGFLAYGAAEQIPGADTIVLDNADSVSKFLKAVYEELGANLELTVLAMHMFGNLAYHHSQAFAGAFGKDSTAYRTLAEIANKMGAKERGIEKERAKKLKDRLDDFLLQWRAILEGDTGEAMRRYASYETDFSWTNWHKDPYPNGVHDLPIKEELRAGGRFKIVVDEKTRDSFFWRANQTLALFQWRIEKEKTIETEGKPIMEFTAGVPVSKISGVTKGLGNELLRKAAKRQRGLTSDVCFVIQGPPTEEYPNGFDFGLKCKSKAERDRFVEWLIEWKEACSI